MEIDLRLRIDASAYEQVMALVSLFVNLCPQVEMVSEECDADPRTPADRCMVCAKEVTSQAVPEAVSKCFRHTSAFVKDKVAEVVTAFYTGSSAELALIEVTLYDHGLLYARSSHRDFVKALVAWGIIKVLPEDEFQRIASNMSSKFTELENECGYMDWKKKVHDKTKCQRMGEVLGPTMPYKR